MHMYLPAHETRGVFNETALKAAKEVILCEAIIDARTFWCAGYRNVTTAYGVEGFTEEMLQTFRDQGTKRVLIPTTATKPASAPHRSLRRSCRLPVSRCGASSSPRGWTPTRTRWR